MKRVTFAASAFVAALALAPAPVLAQEGTVAEEASEEAASSEQEEMEAAMAMLGGMFAAEPLTEEQTARLPQAQRIIGIMLPEGAMAEMMGSMFDDMLKPIMEMAGGATKDTVAAAIGVTSFDLDLTPDQSAEIASIFDPAWEERKERELAIFPQLMGEMMGAMEPAMRKAMSELYAINFTQSELNEIEAFFLTDTGASFARKSFTMSTDPRIISASLEAMPAMMEAMGSMEEKVAEATADLPEKRSFGDLSDAEKARIAEATGFTIEEIEANLEGADYEWDESLAEEAADAVE